MHCHSLLQICANFDRKYWMVTKLKGHKVNMFCKENCLFSPRVLVRGIPDRVEFTPENWSLLVQVMTCCHQASCHYLSQCWPKSMSPYGATRLQWVNEHYGQTKSISYMLMPWLLALPGHQQPWYWHGRINESLFSVKISITCTLSMFSSNRKHYDGKTQSFNPGL